MVNRIPYTFLKWLVVLRFLHILGTVKNKANQTLLLLGVFLPMEENLLCTDKGQIKIRSQNQYSKSWDILTCNSPQAPELTDPGFPLFNFNCLFARSFLPSQHPHFLGSQFCWQISIHSHRMYPAAALSGTPCEY